MRKPPFLFFITRFIMAFLICCLLSGCENGVDFLISGPEETETVMTSSDIYIPIEKVRTLNPIISKDEDTYYIDKFVYEGLFMLDGNLQAQPLLAQSYSYEDNGYSIIIKLKSGVRWHDGEEFNAQDVKFSIDSYLNVLYSNLSIYDNYVNNIKSAKVKDDLTVQIYFKNNKDVAVEKLTFPILPKHAFKNTAAVRSSTEKFVPIGTGPYRVESVDVNKEIVLTANSDYHGSKRAENRVCFRVLPDRLDAVNLFAVNDLTITFSKNIDRDTLLNNKTVKMVSFPSNELELVGFNCRQGALTDSKVRRALAYVIDTDKILESAYYNSGVRSDNLYYPGYMGVDSQSGLLEPDVKKANALLSEAGYKDRDENGFVENEEGEELYIDLLTNSEDESRMAAAQIIQAGLAKLPIHVTVTQVEWEAYEKKLAAGDYDIYIGGYRIQDNFDLRFLLHSARNNPAGYKNEKLDTLLDELESGITAAEKRSAFEKVRTILAKDMPYYCMFYKTYGLIFSEGLEGQVQPYFFHPYSGCEDWFVTYKIKNPAGEE